jgi:hypothetical protein
MLALGHHYLREYLYLKPIEQMVSWTTTTTMKAGGRWLGRSITLRGPFDVVDAPRIAVYDVTGVQTYLSTAQAIFDDMDKAYNTTPCGGLWWDKQHTYVNAIANELYIDVAAHLATRSLYRSGYYLDRALEAWQWFQKSGMINTQWNVNDGLNISTCENNNGTVW